MLVLPSEKKPRPRDLKPRKENKLPCSRLGDAVITTDSDGRLDYMNPVAESLTGWENHEAQSHLIAEVLTVVDDVTRDASESPVMSCLRDGQTLGLSEDTVLINRCE